MKEKGQTPGALSGEQIAAIERRIQAHHKRVGYEGDYDAWLKKVTPPDLE